MATLAAQNWLSIAEGLEGNFFKKQCTLVSKDFNTKLWGCFLYLAFECTTLLLQDFCPFSSERGKKRITF